MVGPLLCTLAGLLMAGPPAPRAPEMTVQDDDVFLHAPPREVARSARLLKTLGADRLRLTAGWSALAPERPARPEDARSYPQAGWRKLDGAVKAAQAAGLKVQIDLAFWAPAWAVTKRVNPARERYEPDPAAFGQFARAVAARYRDVHLWTTWNEPNNTTFLLPQWTRGADGGRRPASPHFYRRMHEAAYAAIKDVDPDDRVLVGGTAAFGGTPGRGAVPPLRFVRELACVDERLEPLEVPECRDFKPIEADGFAYHPYTMRGAPDLPPQGPDEVPLSASGKLATLLDELHDRGRITRSLPLYATEYGYETSPPDPYRGVSPETQARYLSWATFLAWREPSIAMWSQFELRDTPPFPPAPGRSERARWSLYQTGLLRGDGRPKPAARAFALPFWAQRAQTAAGANAVLLFAQVRPGDGRHVVRFERWDPGTHAWTPQPTLGVGPDCRPAPAERTTDRAGYALAFAPAPDGPARYRMAWKQGGGRAAPSLPVDVGPDSPVLRLP